MVKNEITYSRLLSINPHSKHSATVFGPRGTGKTAWVKQQFPDALYFDLLEDDTFRELFARPSRLGERIPTDYPGWVVIDEIQKVPALFNEVHRLIEKKNLRFILTGSSARKLKQAGVNLMAGRALTYHMHPLTVRELGDDFDIRQSLNFGHLPAVIHHGSPKKYLASYVHTYLKEEIQQEGLTRQLHTFTRFMEVASFSQGSVLNYTEIARETGSNRHTIANYFDILEDLLLAKRIYIFNKRAKRALITHPKFYYFDVGVYQTIRPRGPLDTNAEIDGAALETLFLQEVLAMNDYLELGFEIFYWQTQNKVEVDFVLYGEKGLFAFEIKRSDNLTTKDFAGLKLFNEDYPVAKCIMLYGGSRGYYEGNIHVLPIVQALKDLADILNNSSV